MSTKVVVYNRQGVPTHIALFESMAEAVAWRDSHLRRGCFGLRAGVYLAHDLTAIQILSGVEIKDENGAPHIPKKYAVPDQFTVAFLESEEIPLTRGEYGGE
jgi:hypothetical protein